MSNKYVKSTIAMKIMTTNRKHENAEKLIEREVTLMKECRHPNIVEIYSFGYEFDEDTGVWQVFVAMELCDKFIPSTNPKQMEKDIIDLFQAVRKIHARGILHRDLKMDNLLRKNGVLKVCDFGLAKKVPSKGYISWQGTQSHLPDEFSEVQKIPYKLPNGTLAKGFTIKTDMYCLGMTLKEMCKGVEEIPIKIGKLIKNLTSPDPNLRMSAEEVLVFLKS